VEALPEWLACPVRFALAISARNSAICNVILADVAKNEIILREKNKKIRKVLRDEVIDGIIMQAMDWRKIIKAADDNLFVNDNSKAFTRYSLLSRAQYFWHKEGLEKRTIHDLRHTVGTAAGDAGFGTDEIRALMGHDDRSSSAGYVHTDEQTARKVRKSLYKKLVPFFVPPKGENGNKSGNRVPEGDKLICPHCGGEVCGARKYGRIKQLAKIARMAELADAQDLGSCG